MKKAVWRGLTGLTASLFTLSLGFGLIANARTSFLNTRLGTSNYKMVQTGESDSDGTYFDSEFSSLEELLAAQEELATEIASEGVVLLKNNNEALPLSTSSDTVTLWGLNSASPIVGGNIGSSVSAADGQTIYGIEEALQEQGFQLNQDMMDFYAGDVGSQYLMSMNMFGSTVPGRALSPAFTATYEETLTYIVGEIPASEYSDTLLATADGTVAVVVITRDSSEASDYNPDMTSGTDSDSFSTTVLGLSDNEKAMIELAKAHSTKVIVLINADNAMELGDLKNDPDVDAILWVGEPGMYGFLGVAEVIAGEVSPSGCLADTYAASSTSSPAMVNYGLYLYDNASVSDNAVLTTENKADWYLVESEGIYVGYKYYETRYEDQILSQGNATSDAGSSTGSAWDYAEEMVYPFGYGMSYTTFERKLTGVELEIGGTGTATVEVTNTGDVAGKCVVQLYVQAPYTSGGLEKSAIQLLSFGKTDTIEPGDTVTLTIEFDPQYMASYDEDAVKADGTVGAWTLDAGDYYFSVGNGAHEALNNVLAKKLGSTESLITITDDETIDAENAYLWTLDTTDIETYSANVQNALQDADLNNFIEGAVEYTTRSDWTKGWTTVSSIMPTDEMMDGLTNSTYELTENGDGVTWGADNGLSLVDFILTDDDGNYVGVVDWDDEQWDLLVQQCTLEEVVNFVANAGDDIENIDSIGLPRTYANDGPVGFTYDQVGGYAVRWTTSNSSEPTYVSSDSEYASYSMTTMPTEPVVASTFNQELVEREGEIFGEVALWSNESCIFAPGLNIHRTPYCGRNHEYYSEDSMLTNLMGVAICKGGQSKGLMMEPKHFAFNHQELNRSGISTFFNEQAGRENELRGFQGCMQGNYAQGIMTAFNRVGTVFAGADEGTQVQIARNEWGYLGWFVTDMINGADYMNWRDTVFGGGGGCLTSSAYADSTIGEMTSSANIALIEKDTAFQEKLQEIVKYYCYALASSNALNGITTDTEAVYVMTWWQTAFVALEVVTGILTVACGAMYVLSCVRKNGKAKKEA